ncbi:ribosome-associated translation inhibitor RaiA [Aeromicrobium sp. YIM 150415]|uniref:ribosome hibernation-promoting factor, HPF/YfiA family n=1 Tax=Aeromicrobium sp. YIM 150415 TaxID=2803912 RepID=UPI001965AC5D|nr:ribosome-associated translation inhibitor RaiA [Aeromicrobium sp. YIM 150415]MBM9464591.1 ribosome-associated translation inhibitor RaiA [Aeromicrobium sp. YIM 150415]
MEIVVKGRNSEISDRFRDHVAEKLHRIEKFDPRQRITRTEVVVTHEKNPRDPATAAKVEISVHSRGPIVRAEAVSGDQHSALDMAMDRLARQVRKAVDRQRVHRGQQRPTSLSEATADIPDSLLDELSGTDTAGDGDPSPIEVQGDGPLVVREKTHDTAPMTLDQALYEMELVGHDFYLFMEKDSMQPSVVYRRRGYDYGVIHLDVNES